MHFDLILIRSPQHASSLKTDSFYDVNFVVTDSTIMTTSSVPNDDKVAIMTSLRLEWLLCYSKYLLTEWLEYFYISDNLAQ